MSIIQRATLPQEFHDFYSAKLLVTPEPQYLHALLLKMALGAAFSTDEMLGISPDRAFGGNGAPYQGPDEGRLSISDGLYDQSVTLVPELGNGPGHTVRMNRPSFANTTYSMASREVASGTSISTVPIAVSSEQVAVTLKRWAGPYDSANSRVAPFGIDRFDGNVMVHRPAQVVGLNLKRDFDRTVDSFGVTLFDQANTVVRPSGMATDNTPAVAGDYPFTWRLLQSAERQMDDASIPYFGNGKRILVLTPYQAEQLSTDPVFHKLARYDANFNPLFRGAYWNSIGTWDIFKSSRLTQTANTNSIPVHWAQAFGPGAVGCGAGSMPRTAYSTSDNYGEHALVIWLWYAGFEVLDNRFIARIATS